MLYSFQVGILGLGYETRLLGRLIWGRVNMVLLKNLLHLLLKVCYIF